jgi:hypothetical protein
MDDEQLVALFKRAEGGQQEWRERAEKRIVRWQWSSGGPLRGYGVQPFANYVGYAFGRPNKKEPTQKDGRTHAYGVDADDFIWIHRKYAPGGGAFLETISEASDDGFVWVTFALDHGVGWAGRCVFKGTELVQMVTRGWEKDLHQTDIVWHEGRIAKTTTRHSGLAWVTVQQPTRDARGGLLQVLFHNVGGSPEITFDEEITFDRAKCSPKTLKQLEAAREAPLPPRRSVA